VNNTNGTKFAALAVDRDTSTCQDDEAHGDGFVPVKSAIWRVKTYAVSRAKVNTMDILGEVSHFRQVYKWIAVPPKGDHQPDPSTLAVSFSYEELIGPELASVARTMRYGIMFAGRPMIDDADPRPQFSKVLTVASGKPAEIDIPVTGGSRFSLVMLGSPDVSATLINEKGQAIGKNLAGTAEAAEIFRMIAVKTPFQAGKWKLRLETASTQQVEIAVAAFVDYASTEFKKGLDVRSVIELRRLTSRLQQFFARFQKVIGYVEELPGANTQGATLDEAHENLKEAVELVIEANRQLAEEALNGEDVIREPLALIG
jgi:hypothetical protein